MYDVVNLKIPGTGSCVRWRTFDQRHLTGSCLVRARREPGLRLVEGGGETQLLSRAEREKSGSGWTVAGKYQQSHNVRQERREENRKIQYKVLERRIVWKALNVF